MRGPLATAAAIVLTLTQPCLALGVDASAGLAPPGHPGPTEALTGTITSLDPATMNFALREKGIAQRYWVERARRFRGGRRNASFFDLRIGQPVEVTFHESGRLRIADVIAF